MSSTRLRLAFLFVLLVAIPTSLLGAPAPPVRPENGRVVEIKTSLGTITVELYPDKAPATVKNFLRYVGEKHYDGTTFHRVIPTFMIQGGCFAPGMQEKKATHEPIKNEAANGLSNERGTIAVARAAAPDSGTTQFFINVKDNKFLDRNERSAGYAVFGKVIKGMDVVDKIKDVKTGTRDVKIGIVGQFQDVPNEDVVIQSIRVVK
jgi:cyclophilin family peptidyl-prolyl cis-trans isomerase